MKIENLPLERRGRFKYTRNTENRSKGELFSSNSIDFH